MLASDTRVPSIDEIIAVNSDDPDMQVLAATNSNMFVGKGTITFSDLDKPTSAVLDELHSLEQYKLYFIAQDNHAPPNVQTSAVKMFITTPDIEPPVFLKKSPYVRDAQLNLLDICVVLSEPGIVYFAVGREDTQSMEHIEEMLLTIAEKSNLVSKDAPQMCKDLSNVQLWYAAWNR